MNEVARLDTTVTVLDGFRFFEEFETIELLHERFKSEVDTPEDERTVSDLMIDQIEFANVIIVNKVSRFWKKKQKDTTRAQRRSTLTHVLCRLI